MLSSLAYGLVVTLLEFGVPVAAVIACSRFREHGVLLWLGSTCLVLAMAMVGYLGLVSRSTVHVLGLLLLTCEVGLPLLVAGLILLVTGLVRRRAARGQERS